MCSSERSTPSSSDPVSAPAKRRAICSAARSSAGTPLVIDADALDLDRGRCRSVRGGGCAKRPTVVTPHPAEAARLCRRQDVGRPGEPGRSRADAGAAPQRRASSSRARAACSLIPAEAGRSTAAATRDSPPAGTGDVSRRHARRAACARHSRSAMPCRWPCACTAPPPMRLCRARRRTARS